MTLRYAHLSPEHLRAEVEKTEEPSGNIATAVDGIPRPLERLPYWRVVFIVPKTHCEVDSRSNVN